MKNFLKYFLATTSIYFYFTGLFKLTGPESHINTEKYTKPQYKKLILILLDGLRIDGAVKTKNNSLYHNNFKFLSSLSSKNKKSFLSVSGIPTATSIRVKSILTGLPTNFLNGMSTFSLKKTLTDNFINKLSDFYFCGDDTWTDLFPSLLCNSFTIGAYDKMRPFDVEKKVIDLLVSKVGVHDYLLAHLVYLDHYGHEYKTKSENVKMIMIEYDKMVERIYEKMENDTLMVIFSDHGVNDDGSHGGAGIKELSSTCIFINKKDYGFESAVHIENFNAHNEDLENKCIRVKMNDISNTYKKNFYDENKSKNDIYDENKCKNNVYDENKSKNDIYDENKISNSEFQNKITNDEFENINHVHDKNTNDKIGNTNKKHDKIQNKLIDDNTENENTKTGEISTKLFDNETDNKIKKFNNKISDNGCKTKINNKIEDIRDNEVKKGCKDSAILNEDDLKDKILYKMNKERKKYLEKLYGSDLDWIKSTETLELIHQNDIMPTICGLMGLPMPFYTSGTPIHEFFMNLSVDEIIYYYNNIKDHKKRSLKKDCGLRINNFKQDEEIIKSICLEKNEKLEKDNKNKEFVIKESNCLEKNEKPEKVNKNQEFVIEENERLEKNEKPEKDNKNKEFVIEENERLKKNEKPEKDNKNKEFVIEENERLKKNKKPEKDVKNQEFVIPENDCLKKNEKPEKDNKNQEFVIEESNCLEKNEKPEKVNKNQEFVFKENEKIEENLEYNVKRNEVDNGKIDKALNAYKECLILSEELYDKFCGKNKYKIILSFLIIVISLMISLESNMSRLYNKDFIITLFTIIMVCHSVYSFIHEDLLWGLLYFYNNPSILSVIRFVIFNYIGLYPQHDEDRFFKCEKVSQIFNGSYKLIFLLLLYFITEYITIIKREKTFKDISTNQHFQYIRIYIKKRFLNVHFMSILIKYFRNTFFKENQMIFLCNEISFENLSLIIYNPTSLIYSYIIENNLEELNCHTIFAVNNMSLFSNNMNHLLSSIDYSIPYMLDKNFDIHIGSFLMIFYFCYPRYKLIKKTLDSRKKIKLVQKNHIYIKNRFLENDFNKTLDLNVIYSKNSKFMNAIKEGKKILIRNMVSKIKKYLCMDIINKKLVERRKNDDEKLKFMIIDSLDIEEDKNKKKLKDESMDGKIKNMVIHSLENNKNKEILKDESMDSKIKNMVIHSMKNNKNKEKLKDENKKDNKIFIFDDSPEKYFKNNKNSKLLESLSNEKMLKTNIKNKDKPKEINFKEGNNINLFDLENSVKKDIKSEDNKKILNKNSSKIKNTLKFERNNNVNDQKISLKEDYFTIILIHTIITMIIGLWFVDDFLFYFFFGGRCFVVCFYFLYETFLLATL